MEPVLSGRRLADGTGGGAAWANNLPVTNTLDETTGGNGCSLREAITNANDDAQTFSDCPAGAGPDTITFSVSGTITLDSTLGNLLIDSDITIDGTGQSVTVSGGNAVRVMLVNSGATLRLDKLTVANGFAVGGFDGGGIRNLGTLTVSNSTFSNNGTGTDGGGIANDFGFLTVTNSTFSGNSVSGSGGGILNQVGFATVTNSTFSGNAAGGLGGGIASSGTLNLANTILANSPSGGDCRNDGTLNTSGVNLVEDGSCGSSFPPSTDPKLGPLAPNGGPTQTHALLAGSPAIDAADDAICDAPPVNSLDQRGVSRPQGDHCDIGAFEAVPADLAVAKADNPDPALVNDQLTWTITVTNSGMSDATGVKLTDTLPASGFTFVSTSSSQGSCSPPASGAIDCNLGNLANGGSATVTIKVTLTAEGTLSNTVEVMGNEFDDNLANNTATQTTTVNALLCNGLIPTIVGTPGNNTITGTNGNDVIHGLGGQ